MVLLLRYRLKSNSHAQKIHACIYTPVCIYTLVCKNLNCVRMGFIARSIFVGKFIISGLTPVHLSFLYLQNKKRLLQCVLVDFGSRGESYNGQA